MLLVFKPVALIVVVLDELLMEPLFKPAIPPTLEPLAVRVPEVVTLFTLPFCVPTNPPTLATPVIFKLVRLILLTTLAALIVPKRPILDEDRLINKLEIVKA